jgi:hypothetical protein
MARPQWSEKIDERGTPVDPLNANRSRNRFTNLFAHGTITSIPLRLRYLSVFCWALDQLADSEEENRYEHVKNIEKIFCLASRYRQLQADHSSEAIRGMDGNSEFSLDDEEFDAVDLDAIELLKNDGYAYAQFYENQLQNYMLKRGEFTLTEAGQELAAIVDTTIGTDRDRLLRCAKQGEATRADFEAIAESVANQSVYLESECLDERRALQKVLLGFVEWTGDKQTGSVALADEPPAEIPLNVLDQLEEVIETGEVEEAVSSNLYRRYHRKYHRYRAAHAAFLIRSWQLQDEATADRIALADADKQTFQQYRALMRLYWLQVYAGYVVESQLEALTTVLNSRIPPRYSYETLLEQVIEPATLNQAFADVTNELTTISGTEKSSPSQRTRNLMLYGTTDLTRPDVSISGSEPETADFTEMQLGTARSQMQDLVSEGWDTNPAIAGASTVNEVLLGKTIRQSLNRIRDTIDDPDQQFRHWTRSLARSVALLLLVVERFERINDQREWLYNYAYNRFESPYASLPALTRVVTQTADEIPLHEFARDVLTDRVVETHLQVFYSRLSPGNLKRILSFDQDERLCLEVDRERGSRPFRASVSLVRFSELNTLLRDAGLLTDTEEGYKPTDHGREILSRVNSGDGS